MKIIEYYIHSSIFTLLILFSIWMFLVSYKINLIMGLILPSLFFCMGICFLYDLIKNKERYLIENGKK